MEGQGSASLANPSVLLIGGAPGVGKTTLGRALGARLGVVSLTIDHLRIAARAITTPQSHPGLHVMSRVNHVEYFTTSSVDQLIADAREEHEALWPVVEKVIRSHSAGGSGRGSPIVIDGWALIPRRVIELGLDNVASYWLVIDPAVLREREHRNTAFFNESPDPPRMLSNFLARSLWHNDFIKEQAAERGLNVLRQDGSTSVDDLCRMVAMPPDITSA